MAIGPKLEARISQRLSLTPGLRESISILGFSAAELTEFLESEAVENPLMDVAKKDPGATWAQARGSHASLDSTASVADIATLQQHVAAQVRLAKAPPNIIQLAELIATDLDDDGFYRGALSELADHAECSGSEAKEALALVQACEPAGVGARSLAETYLLQLKDSRSLTPEIATFLETLQRIAAVPSMANLATELDLSEDVIQGILHVLEDLDPAPGGAFSSDQSSYVVPDILVASAEDGQLSVSLNEAAFPNVLVDQNYLKLVADDPKAMDFAKMRLRRANWLKRAAERRATTILRLATAIVDAQTSFFSLPDGPVKPLTRKSVADTLDLSASTVSRALQGKFLSCTRGVFPVSHFFSYAVPIMNGADQVSSDFVRSMIRDKIKAEDKTRPLSDDAILKELTKNGIQLARRTVAKYRTELGIPSTRRRRHKVSAVK